MIAATPPPGVNLSICIAPVIYGFARKRGLQDADAADLMQEVLRSVSTAAQRLDYDPNRGSFRGWLFTVTRNKVYNFCRAAVGASASSVPLAISRARLTRSCSRCGSWPTPLPLPLGLRDRQRHLRSLVDQAQQLLVDRVDALAHALDAGRTAGRALRVRLTALQVLEPAELIHQCPELREGQRLVAVGPRMWRIGMNLDDQAVGADCGGTQGHRPTSERLPVPCDGSTTTGRWVISRSTGTAERSSVLRVARSNVRMPRSHRITLALPADRTYSAAISHSSIVAPKPRLSSTGVRPWPAARSSVKLCMLRLPIWMMSTSSSNDLHLAGVGHLRHDRQAGFLARLDHQLESVLAQTLERVRRSPWLEGAAAQHVRALGFTSAAVSMSISTDSTAHGPAMTTSGLPAPIGDAADHDPRAVALVLEARELVRRGDADRLLDAGHRADVRDAVDIDADDADDRALLALAHEGLQAFGADERADGVDLLLRRSRLSSRRSFPNALSE